MLRLKYPILAMAAAMAAATAPAQTILTWGGGFPDDNLSTAANWTGGTPVADGSQILQLNPDSDGTLRLDTAANFLGIDMVGGFGFSTDVTIKGPNSLSIGSGGITMADSGGGPENSLQIGQNVNVILTAPQVWYNGSIASSVQVNGLVSDTGGSPSLTLVSDDYAYATFTFNSGSSTFSGGVTVQGIGTGLIVGTSSTGTSPSVTMGPVGTGILTLGDGTQLTTNTSSPVTIGNAVTIGDDSSGSPITLGGPTTRSNPGTVNLTLSGPISLYIDDEEIDVGSNSRVTLSGGIVGPSYCLDFGGPGSAGSALAILTGPVSVSRLDLEDNGTVIFDGGPSQLTVADDFGTTPSSYVGIGSSYSGSVATFLTNSTIGTYASNFSGTLGFDTVSGSAATFGDLIDLTNFTNVSFVGLGSATSAVLTGAITPPTAEMNATYPFGGGGGKLYVRSSVADVGTYPSNIMLSPGNAPLTLVLQGSLSYSGTTSAAGGALILDTPVSPHSAAGSFIIGNESAYGYIGYTENATIASSTMLPSQFLTLIDPGSVNGVVGFDSHTPSGPRTIADTIDLTAAPFSSNTFIGTATSVILDGSIVPAAGGPYQFTGVKGGQLTVSSSLSNIGGPTGMVIGLRNPMESFGSQSSVTLNADNYYSGGTTLNSGYLYVTTSNSIGTGALTVPEPPSYRGWAATLAASGVAVALENAINIPSNGLALNTGSSGRLTLNGPIQDDVGESGYLGIFGPVDLNGPNTYTGGTTIDVGPSTVINIGSDTGLGTGQVTAFGGIINFTSPAPSLGDMQVSGSTLNFAGSPIISSIQMAQTTINFADGTSPVIEGLDGGSSGSGNVINLGTVTGATLTFSLGTDPDYAGTINGPGALVVNGNELNLTGANTFSGGTTVGANGMVIASNNSALGTGAVTVGSSGTLVTNTGVTVTNAITLSDGGTIAGFGTFSPGANLTFQNGSSLVAGAVILSSGSATSIPAIGTLAFGGTTSLTFGSGGNMAFSITDANGAPGVGYSTVSVAGGLTVTNSGSPFNIYLFSFAPGANVPDSTQAANFNPLLSYQWTLLSTGTGITGFAANDFSINLSGFGSTSFLNPTGTGSFFVSEVGNDLMLNFTPVPEPTTLALMASGICALGAGFRRRRR